MENDSIRPSGSNTLADIWVEGKLRSICVTATAIETYLGSSGFSQSTEESRCEFVRTHLDLVVSATKVKLKSLGDRTEIIIEGGELRSDDRRQAERRVQDRRKAVA